MRNRVLLGWVAEVGSASRTHPLLSPPVMHPRPPSIPHSSLPVTFLNTSCGAVLSHCSVPRRTRFGCQNHPVPSEEEELLSPALMPKATGSDRLSSPQGLRCRGPGAGTAPLLTGFKSEGRGTEQQQQHPHPSPACSWQHDAPAATAGRGCAGGSWERWPPSCCDPARGSNKLLPKGPLFLSCPPPSLELTALMRANEAQRAPQ